MASHDDGLAVTMHLQVPDLRSVPASRRGELLVRLIIARWEDPARDDELIVLLRTAVTSEVILARPDESAVFHLINITAAPGLHGRRLAWLRAGRFGKP